MNISLYQLTQEKEDRAHYKLSKINPNETLLGSGNKPNYEH